MWIFTFVYEGLLRLFPEFQDVQKSSFNTVLDTFPAHTKWGPHCEGSPVCKLSVQIQKQHNSSVANMFYSTVVCIVWCCFTVSIFSWGTRAEHNELGGTVFCDISDHFESPIVSVRTSLPLHSHLYRCRTAESTILIKKCEVLWRLHRVHSEIIVILPSLAHALPWHGRLSVFVLMACGDWSWFICNVLLSQDKHALHYR